MSTTSTLTGHSETAINDQFATCPFDNPIPSYAKMVANNIRMASLASTVTGSAAASTQHDTNHHGYGQPSHWQQENQRLHSKLKTQNELLLNIQQTKQELEHPFQRLNENIQSKECRTIELEDRIAQLLNIVYDRDQQMAERDQQIELRNQQFDTIMEKLNLQMAESSIPRNEQDLSSSAFTNTPTRANKRQNVQQTPLWSPPEIKYHNGRLSDTGKKQK